MTRTCTASRPFIIRFDCLQYSLPIIILFFSSIRQLSHTRLVEKRNRSTGTAFAKGEPLVSPKTIEKFPFPLFSTNSISACCQKQAELKLKGRITLCRKLQRDDITS